jgi:hypothetical protein
MRDLAGNIPTCERWLITPGVRQPVPNLTGAQRDVSQEFRVGPPGPIPGLAMRRLQEAFSTRRIEVVQDGPVMQDRGLSPPLRISGDFAIVQHKVAIAFIAQTCYS